MRSSEEDVVGTACRVRIECAVSEAASAQTMVHGELSEQVPAYTTTKFHLRTPRMAPAAALAAYQNAMISFLQPSGR
ncbi:hypothetical protein H0A70_06240 [Alcaligenaceae bacterium]|nr:hypothetical protein [Alcaligenaceae bacterium]